MAGFRSLLATTAFRWTMSIACGFIAMALALFGFIYWQTAVREAERVDAVVRREARVLSDGPEAGVAAELRRWLSDDAHEVRYGGLFTEAGASLAGNPHRRPAGLPLDGEARQTVFLQIDRDRAGGSPETVRAVAVPVGGGQVAVIGYDADELEDLQAIILRALGLGLLPTVALSLLVGTLLAMRAQRRVATVHEAIGRIMHGQLGERLPVRGSGDDMDRLSAAVNAMLQEIERLVGEIRGVGGNIAHDLRTPLMRVRSKLERGRDEARTPAAFQDCIDRATESVDQALAVVSAILRISEIEHSRRQAAFRAIDLADVARDAFELYEPVAEENGLLLRLDAGRGALVFGDRDLLLEAMGNLLDNALKFAPAGSAVMLSVTAEADHCLLCVLDRGRGIPEAERGRVLRRFYRGEKSRAVGGSGLGLNLVSAIVLLHGFALTIGDAQPGCSVTIGCPAWRPDPPSPSRKLARASPAAI